MNPSVKRIVTVALVFIAVAAAIAFYALHDPSADHIAPRCLFHAITGWDCPGCGFQRALHALFNGNVHAAWQYNPFLFFMLPAAAVYILIETFPSRFPRLRKVMLHPTAVIAVATAIIIWWIVRNI